MRYFFYSRPLQNEDILLSTVYLGAASLGTGAVHNFLTTINAALFEVLLPHVPQQWRTLGRWGGCHQT